MNDACRFPVIESARLRMRELELEDVDALYAYLSLPEVARWTDVPPMEVRDEAFELVEYARARFEAGKGLRWGIEERATGRLVGDIGFNGFEPEDYSGDIGYILAPTAWGRGIATEAVAAVVRYGFERFDRFRLNRIEAVTDPENGASQRVLTKLGFTYEGLLRHHRFEKGRFVDECCFSFLRSDLTADWPPRLERT